MKPRCDDYQVMFSDNLRFDRPRTRMIFSAECLGLPIKRTPQELQRFLSQAPANILVKYRAPESLASRIKHDLRYMPPTPGRRLSALPPPCASPRPPCAAAWQRKGRPTKASRTAYARNWRLCGWLSRRSASLRLPSGWDLLIRVRFIRRFVNGAGRIRGIIGV